MLSLHSDHSNAWQRFLAAVAKDGVGDLVLMFDQSDIPMWLLPVSRIVQSNIYFAVPAGESLKFPDAVGEDGRSSTPAPDGEFSSWPPGPMPTEDAGDPHFPPPIQRLKLRQPLSLGNRRTLRIRVDVARPEGGAPQLKRAWLVCWLEGVEPPPS